MKAGRVYFGYPGIIAAPFLAAIILFLALSAAWPGEVHAGNRGNSGCRRDPIVRLSDGTVAQIGVQIGAPLSEVSSIAYTLHAPQGTTVEQVIYTAGPNNPPESLQFYADMPQGRYVVETVVQTANPGAEVILSAHVGPAIATAAGLSGQPVSVQLDR